MRDALNGAGVAAFGRFPLAEGVKRGEQLGLLREMGCELAQGYYFCGALSAESAGELLVAYSMLR